MRSQNKAAFLVLMIFGALSFAGASFYFTRVNPFEAGNTFKTRIGITSLLFLCTAVFSLFSLFVHPRWVKRLRRKRRALWIQMAIDLSLLMGILVTVIVVWIQRWPLPEGAGDAPSNLGPVLGSLLWPPLTAYALSTFLVHGIFHSTDDVYEPCTYPLMPGADTVNTRIGYMMRLVPLLFVCLSSFFLWATPSIGPAAQRAKAALANAEKEEEQALIADREDAEQYKQAVEEADRVKSTSKIQEQINTLTSIKNLINNLKSNIQNNSDPNLSKSEYDFRIQNSLSKLSNALKSVLGFSETDDSKFDLDTNVFSPDIFTWKVSDSSTELLFPSNHTASQLLRRIETMTSEMSEKIQREKDIVTFDVNDFTVEINDVKQKETNKNHSEFLSSQTPVMEAFAQETDVEVEKLYKELEEITVSINK